MAQHQQEIRNLFVRTAIEHLLRITEAVFSPEQSFLWAVQWHPELSFEKNQLILPLATRTVTRERKIVIGTQAFSQVQVRNALYKAVGDLIYNKNYGIIAKMNGKAKRRKV